MQHYRYYVNIFLSFLFFVSESFLVIIHLTTIINILWCKIMTKHLTKKDFLEKVFNYEKNSEWVFEGTKPCLIDFYADWCGPCKMVAPVLEELSDEFEGQIDIYKINTEVEQELAAAFGIRSIPSLLFVPMEGQPQMAMGALPKEAMKEAIDKVLLHPVQTN